MRNDTLKAPDDTPNSGDIGLRSVLIIVAAQSIGLAITAVVAELTGAPFVLWYSDTHYLLLAVFAYLAILGIFWDGSLIALGILNENWTRFTRKDSEPAITVESMRKIRFFTCGPWPIITILATTFGILGTSNLTLINLNLLGSVTEWHDPLFWMIEAPILERIASLPINAAAWDRLYHSAWLIEGTVAFIIVLLARKSQLILQYCLSMVILFYFGRYLGLLTPVMGPGIFKPEFFGYLSGSYTETAMQLVGKLMALPPDEAKRHSGVLLGGVSAMPSLHVGMVSLTAYWLATAKRWTLIFSIPWVLMVWTSTVVLGWHYVLDGAGGMALAAVCVWATYRLLGVLDMKIQSPILLPTPPN